MNNTAQRVRVYDTSRFMEQFEKWLDDCLVEFNQRHYDEALGPVKYHDMNCPEAVGHPIRGFHPAQWVEFTMDGTAYRHGFIKPKKYAGAVTPWHQSSHFAAL